MHIGNPALRGARIGQNLSSGLNFDGRKFNIK